MEVLSVQLLQREKRDKSNSVHCINYFRPHCSVWAQENSKLGRHYRKVVLFNSVTLPSDHALSVSVACLAKEKGKGQLKRTRTWNARAEGGKESFSYLLPRALIPLFVSPWNACHACYSFSFFLNHCDQKLSTSIELNKYKSWALTVIAVMSMIVSQKARLEMTPLGAVFTSCKKGAKKHENLWSE